MNRNRASRLATRDISHLRPHFDELPKFVQLRRAMSGLGGLLILVALSAPAPGSHASTSRPNIVLILADDLGWSDTTLYGTTDFYRTPHIQQLAERGMTFTRAYAASPLCSPTRASLLTGLSPARHGVTAPNCHTPTVRLEVGLQRKAAANRNVIQPDSVTRLDPSHITIAESLKAAGYVTGHFGKWHLGAEPYSPLQHGFDVDVPHWHGPGPAGSYVAPWKFKDFDHDPDIPDEHIEDRMAKEAVAFMREYRDKPFFLNYWMFSVHAPFDAKSKLIEKYGRLVDAADHQRCPTYAAMIESMDDAVGTLTGELKSLGIADNTIIVFASDNGGNMYNLVEGERPTSNRPLRGGKATMYEGGVRTPAVIVWPNHVHPGSRSDAVIQSMDYYPTLLEMLDLEPQDNQTFDGISLLPALRGQTLDRDGIFTYFPHSPPVPDWLPPSISVHHDKWKLIRLFHGGENGAHRYKLFDLDNDIGEQTNLAQENPDQVRALDALIDAHLDTTSAVVPIENPEFDSAKYSPEQEGVAAEKFQRGIVQRSPGIKAVPVAEWLPGGTGRLSVVDSALHVQSTGNDPYLSHRLATPISPGALVLKIRMKSDSKGFGQVFWKNREQSFSADRSQQFKVAHDAREHSYEVRFSSDSAVHSLRIDPSRSSGTIELLDIHLLDVQGQTVKRWRF